MRNAPAMEQLSQIAGKQLGLFTRADARGMASRTSKFGGW